MSCVQLPEGGFQVVYPLGLWSRSSGVVKVLHGTASKLLTVTVTLCHKVRKKYETKLKPPVSNQLRGVPRRATKTRPRQSKRKGPGKRRG